MPSMEGKAAIRRSPADIYREEVEDLNIRVNRLEDTGRELAEHMTRLSTIILGNGNPKEGMAFKVELLVKEMESLQKIGWIIATSVIGILVVMAVKLILSNGASLIP